MSLCAYGSYPCMDSSLNAVLTRAGDAWNGPKPPNLSKCMGSDAQEALSGGIWLQALGLRVHCHSPVLELDEMVGTWQLRNAFVSPSTQNLRGEAW